MSRGYKKRNRKKRTLEERLSDFKHEWFDPSPVPGSEEEDGTPAMFHEPYGKNEEVGFAWTINNKGEREPVYLAVHRHSLVAGTTGGGKSVTTNAIITQLAQIGPPCPGNKKEDGTPYKGVYCALVGADLKGGIELASWFPRFSFVATKLNEVDFLLDKLLEENERRAAQLRQKGYKKIVPSKKNPLIICVIDELAEVTASKEPGKQYADAKKAAEKEGKSFDEYRFPQNDDSRRVKLRRLSALGRSQGIFLIVATQKPSSKLIDTDFRDNFDQRLCHRVNTADNVKMILGIEGKYAPAHRFPGDMPGMMYAKVATHKDPVQCRSEYYSDEEIDAIAAATAHKRCKLDFLYMPKYLYTGSVMEEQAQKTYSLEQHELEYEENKEIYDAMGYDDDNPDDVPPVITDDMVFGGEDKEERKPQRRERVVPQAEESEPEPDIAEIDPDIEEVDYPDEIEFTDIDELVFDSAGWDEPDGDPDWEQFDGEAFQTAMPEEMTIDELVAMIVEDLGDKPEPAREQPEPETQRQSIDQGDDDFDDDEVENIVKLGLVGEWLGESVPTETTRREDRGDTARKAIPANPRKGNQTAAPKASLRTARKGTRKLTKTKDGLVLTVPKVTERSERQEILEKRRREGKAGKPKLHAIPPKQPRKTKKPKNEGQDKPAKRADEVVEIAPAVEEPKAAPAKPPKAAAQEGKEKAGKSKKKPAPTEKKKESKQEEPIPEAESISGIDTASLMDAIMGLGDIASDAAGVAPDAMDDDDWEDESMDPEEWEWNEPEDDVPF